MKRYLWAVFCLALCLFESPANSQVVGLKRGMSVEQVKAVGFGTMETFKMFPDTWFIERPDSLRGASFMALYIPPDRGLLMFRIVWELQSDPYGGRLREAFDLLYKGMSEKYGRGERLNYLKRGSAWTQPEHYMKGLAAQERVLQWTIVLRPSSRNEYLESVGLIASAYDERNGSVTLIHCFGGYHDYTAKQPR